MAAQLSATAHGADGARRVIARARLPQDQRPQAPLVLARAGPAALLLPWLMFPAIGRPAEALEPAKLWDAVWSMLGVAALAAGVWRWEIVFLAFLRATSSSPRRRRSVPQWLSAPRSSGLTESYGSGRRRASRCS